MKCCNRCGQIKSLREFGRNRAKRDGLASCCLVCCRETDRQRDRQPARRTAKRAYLKLRTWWLRQWVLVILTDGKLRCARCGATDRLEIDHTAGDGKKHRQLAGRKLDGNWKRNARYRYYRNMLESGCAQLQVLCSRCNLIRENVNRQTVIKRHSTQTGRS